MTTERQPTPEIVSLRGAGLRYGNRSLFHGLDLQVHPGEFVAVLGPNGVGKTSLLRVLLGLEPLSQGTAQVCSQEPRGARRRVGYIPQQRAFDRDLPIRGRDLVQFGLDGSRPGLARPTRGTREKVDAALMAVDAATFAYVPLGTLSGGEQQRLRVAQALLTEPQLLLCDEPLLSLDPTNQQTVCQLIDQRRRTAGTAVVFVTHEINPVLPYVDRVLYLAAGNWSVGTAQEVLTTERLTKLYGSPVEVVHVGGRIIIVGGDSNGLHHPVRELLMGLGWYLSQGFAQHALIAGALVAITCGLIGPFVIIRNMAFAVHGTSELAFTGAAAGLLIADDPIAGALIGAVVVAAIIGLLGVRERERDSAIGVVLAFGLGLGVLLLSYYRGFATAATNILFGDIFGISTSQILLLVGIGIVAAIAMTLLHRPLLFASVDPDVATARGLPVRRLGLVFLIILAVTVTAAAQIVGTLLVLSLAITPAAAAQRLTAKPLVTTALSVLFALLATEGGLLASLQSGSIKPSVFITGISFVIYLLARLLGPIILSQRQSPGPAPSSVR